jgi:subtilisin family serine protease
LGYRGQGIVVANLDTGVDGSHPDLAPKWRGGTNSWFDPYNQHPTIPTDLAGGSSGHGTRTMGIMVGGEHNGTGFGVAPEAQWIAAKVFKDDGTGTTAGFHASFQWLLNPDGNPTTPDAPDVVNNSWTYGNPNSCNLEFQPDLQALRAAGILPIFAAGNSGFGSTTNPAPTSHSPAN